MNLKYTTLEKQSRVPAKVEAQVDMLCFLAQPKRRKTTNLKTKNNQNSEIIKLYGSLKTKELKKRHSFRLVGGAEMGSWGGEDM